MCNQFGPTRGALESCGDKRAVKRKLDDPFCDIYVPPKRISPFLNTPKEKKEERRKILKMSIKKLKQLEDPETFLRRTVLVNNTRKRIQSELKEEKATGKYEYKSSKSSLAYDVLNNDCLSNSYLLDDPFLSGIHDKITDDMTDTLINNLKDKLCDNVVDSDPKHMDTSDSSFTNSEVCKSSDSNAGSCKQTSQKPIGQFTELKSVSETSCHKSVGSGESRVPGDVYSSYQNISENNNDIKVESNTCSSDCSVPLQNDGHILDQCAHSHSSQTFVAHAPDRLVSMPDFRIQSVTDQDKENTGSSSNSVNYFSSTSDWCVDIDQDMSVCGKSGSDVRDMEPLHPMGNKQVLSHSTYVRTNLDVDQTFQLYSLITGKEL